MPACLHCDYENRVEARFCIMCGAQLPPSTLYIPKDKLDNIIPEIRWGTILFGENFDLELRIADRSLIMPLSLGHSFTIGRGERSENQIETSPLNSVNAAINDAPVIILESVLPHVDLTPFGASDAGVSRLHIRLCHEGPFLTVEDLGSTNGTRLNGNPLIPFQKRLLRDTDELLLGFMSIKVAFHHHQIIEQKAS